jgi:hypothetical protein
MNKFKISQIEVNLFEVQGVAFSHNFYNEKGFSNANSHKALIIS